MNPILHIFESAEDTARGVAELILEKAKKKNKQSLPINIAVSGGTTPKLLFKLLAEEYADSIPWHFVRLFWVDERCVPPTHPESNFGMTFETLLKNVPIHESNIYRMQGENDPAKEAARYQQLLQDELPMQSGFPHFDIILLGMGDDGHTASIFPNNLSLLNTESIVEVGIHPESGQKRITLTGGTINQAESLVFMITGNSKKKVLSQIIHKDIASTAYPAAYVHSSSGIADFYLDKIAASNL